MAVLFGEYYAYKDTEKYDIRKKITANINYSKKFSTLRTQHHPFLSATPGAHTDPLVISRGASSSCVLQRLPDEMLSKSSFVASLPISSVGCPIRVNAGVM